MVLAAASAEKVCADAWWAYSGCGHASATVCLRQGWHAEVVCARVACCTGLGAGGAVLGSGLVRPCGGSGA